MKQLSLHLATILVALQAATTAEEIQFNRDVRPILSKNCFACHGPSEDAKASLHLHTFERATDNAHPKRKGKAAIVPGNPDKSRAIQLIESTDANDIMPPPESHKELTPQEKRTLRAWVKQGAQYQAHWSLLPVQNQTNLPNHQHPIDSLVRQQLQDTELKPQSAADKRTLIRRLCFDLTGLPPTVEQTRMFLADMSPEAYDRLVDNLLASPAYGEHMARYWLDLVRYGDSHGIHGDNYREMYLYRDWVIKAFNNNQPFDEFAIDQLAGDLRQTPNEDQLIASGFNRLHVSNSAGSALKEELYFNNVVDRTAAFGTVFLGLTVGCAQCHDHKYDPISHKEFYQLFAFFNNLDGPPDNGGKKSPEPAIAVPTKAQEIQVANLQKILAEVKGNQTRTTAVKKQIASTKKQFPTTMIMRERKTKREAFIYDRGQYDLPGPKVSRGTPAALPPMTANHPRDRMGLAQWLTAPNHPLTARVAVNRFWQQLFGTGLVRSSEDLGSQGDWPSHPELLDHLAHRFVSSGWDVKALMRHLTLSETYRQRSDAGAAAYEADPENAHLARGPRFRLDAEMLRDQALATSGLLVRDMYGPSVKPPQPAGLWKSVALPVSKPNRYEPDTGNNIYRRSIYSYIKRAYPPPSMTIFNAPTRESCISRRERTNTPLQALVLMNEEQFFEAAGALAEKVLKIPSRSDVIRINHLWEHSLARPATTDEAQACVQYLNRFRDDFNSREKTIRLGKKSVHPETAAWTLLASAILNLDMTKTKE